MGAVGPAQFIIALNGRVRSFDKATGTADAAVDDDTDAFFGSVMTPGSNTTTDPRIRYDRLAGRWFITMIDVPGGQGTQPNRVMIALSDSGVITSGTVWTFYQFEHDLVGTTPNSDTGDFADYPTLGIDANALYIGVNVFTSSGSFANTTAFVVQKSSLLTGGPLQVTAFRGLSPGNVGPLTAQGVDNYDPTATEGYFIGANSLGNGQLILRRVSAPGGASPSLSGDITINVAPWHAPINVTALDTPGQVDGGDVRLLAAHFRNGALWTSHNVAVNGTGGSFNPNRNGVRWYQLTGIPSGQTPSVVQSGTVYQPGSMGNRSFWMGTIMVSGQGHAAMGFSAAGPTNYIDAMTVGRLANDPPGTMQTPVAYTSSDTGYNPTDNVDPHRWGDFSFTSLDPSDDMTMWTIQEWCQSGGDGYAVQVAKLLAPPPAMPTNCTPATLTQAVAGVTVTIKGSAADGAGFFDPGPAFSNRLALAVAGGGVRVDSVTYNNPSNLTAVVTVADRAAAGTRTITVVNPDGQSVTSASALLTIARSGTNAQPTLAPIADQTIALGMTLILTNTAGDPDGDQLIFSLAAGAATNATIGATSGVFEWTPIPAQRGTNRFSVIVTDYPAPSLSATQSFTVTVVQSNRPPVLAPIANQIIYALTLLSLTNSATDPDAGQVLTFSLAPGAPAGASIGASNGILSWIPGVSQTDTNSITVRVTDSGLPNLSDAKTFNVAVQPWPTLTVASVSSNGVTLSWDAISGRTYQVQFKTNLADPGWSVVAPVVTAGGATASTTDTNATGTTFYRLMLVP